MSLLKWFYTETGTGNPPPQLVYYALRGGMFLLSFVLEDWAIYELVPSPRHRRATVVLVASSYVTWTYQTHTFSNSVETLLVAWGLVLIRRILENKVRAVCACGGAQRWLWYWWWPLTNWCRRNARPSSPTPFSRLSQLPVSLIALHSLHSCFSQVCNCCLISGASKSPRSSVPAQHTRQDEITY